MNTKVFIKHLSRKLNRAGITLQTFKISLAAGISWWLATFITPHFYPYIAPLTAVLITNTTFEKAVTKAIHRFLGVVGGVACSLIVSQWIMPSGMAAFLSIFIGMAMAKTLKLHQDSISQIGVTVVMVLAFLHSGGYEWARIMETVIGSVVAIFVTILLPNRKAGHDDTLDLGKAT
ncbi:FUSC family protein [Bacillus smithii]|uniref:FUSC family protein n=1 Tax=Bacillus smithii TaxID=1479 RepID=UPI0030C92C87